MAAQIHIAGSSWIRVSRQFVTRSLIPTKSMAKAPTHTASGASHRRDRLSRRMTSSAVARSLSLTARTNRLSCSRRVACREGCGCPWPGAGAAVCPDALPSIATFRELAPGLAGCLTQHG